MMMSYKPILGICHGAFLLTDVLGGQVGPISGHSDTTHSVDYFGKKIEVNSFHNQSILHLHHSGQTLATDQDGQIEAWIDGYMAGIVWHPERMSDPFIPAEIQQIMKL
jgi:putative glutamine amidotransferase